MTRPNPNSAVVWHYAREDVNGDGKIEFEETMHRTIGSVAIKDDLLFIADFSGIFHCLDAKTGKRTGRTTVAACWGSPLIVDGKVYIGDEDGDVSVFGLSANPDAAMPRGATCFRGQREHVGLCAAHRGQRRAVHHDPASSVCNCEGH